MISSPWLRYLAMTGVLIVAIFFRLALFQAEIGVPYLTFYPGLVLTVTLAGLGPGIAYIALSALAADYIFLPPFWEFDTTREGLLASGTYILASAAMLAMLITFQRRITTQTVQLQNELAMRRQVEEGMREREREFVAMFEGSVVGKAQADPQTGRFLRVNQAFANLTGYTREELCGMTFLDITHPDDRQRDLGIYDSVRRGQACEWQNEKRYLRKDGTEIWVNESGNIIDSGEGFPARTIAVIQDITDRKRTETALRESEERLTLALDSGQMGLWAWDLANDRLIWNAKEYELLGLPVGDGHPQAEVFFQKIHPEDFDRIIRGVAAVLESGIDWRDEFRIVRPDGQIRWLAGVAKVHRDKANRPVQMLGINHDITARKLAEADSQRLQAELEDRVAARTAKLAQTNEALLKSNMELQRFAHVAAHDLQTPLRSIASFAQLLQQEYAGRLDSNAQQYIHWVVENTRRMKTLVDDLLAYARLDAQAKPFAPCDMQALLADVRTSLGPMLGETHTVLTHGALPTVMGDCAQLAQVLTNLIENGIKYNRSEDIRVHVSATPGPDGWVFSVRDNGIGIDPRHHQQIFETFKRLHTYHEYPGSGIGLSICQRIIERHGGRIWLESSGEGGSTFHFTLPAAGGAPL